MKIYPFKGSHPKVELVTSPKSFFGSIKAQYREYKENNIYTDLDKECLFVLQIKTTEETHTGLLSLTDIKEMANHKILKHEKTLATKEQQMMHLLLKRKALVKPVLLGFKSNKMIDGILNAMTRKKSILDVTFEHSGERHRVWKIADPEKIDEVVKLFSKVKKAYIGDGHHRSTTTKLLSESKQLGPEAKKYKALYTAYFPFSQLKICDFNRMVDISQMMSLPDFIIGLSKYFEITKIPAAAKPKKKHQVTIYLDRQWYKLKWRDKYLKKNKNNVLLDSALINKYVFGEILGIEDVRVDTRISYFGGTLPLTKIESAAHKCAIGIGICIYPVSVKELTALADKKKTLPPKSTWFLPRLKSGLITSDL